VEAAGFTLVEIPDAEKLGEGEMKTVKVGEAND